MFGKIVGIILIIGLSGLIVWFTIDIIKIAKRKKAAKSKVQKNDVDLKHDDEKH